MFIAGVVSLVGRDKLAGWIGILQACCCKIKKT